MNAGQCSPGTTQGFPLVTENEIQSFSQEAKTHLFTNTAQEFDIAPAWSPTSSPPSSWTISIDKDAGTNYLYIKGFPNSAITLQYEGVSYKCLDYIGICNVQHRNLILKGTPGNYPYELYVGFQQLNPGQNPTAPALIFMTRPFRVSETAKLDGWVPIANKITGETNTLSSTLNIQSLFTEGGNLLPAIAYETCLSADVKDTNGSLSKKNIRVKTYVTSYPLDLPRDTRPSSSWPTISNMRLAFTPSDFSLSNFAFSNTTTAARTLTTNTFIPYSGTQTPTSELTKKIQLLLPSSLMAQDPGSLLASGTLPTPVPTRRAVSKCYPVDPKKDIKNGQILIDPTTGQSLSKMLSQQAIDDAGGDPDLAAALQGQPVENPGILPGDIQKGILITAIVIGSLIGLALLCYTIFQFVYGKKYDSEGYLKKGLIGLAGFIFFIIVLGIVSAIFAKSN